MLGAFSRALLKLLGWRRDFHFPETAKYVMIVAPHTSNWDFIIGVLTKWAEGLQMRYLGKDSLFKSPLGWFFRKTGGMPVDRSGKHRVVDQMVERFAAADALVLALSPEGTRSRTEYWKSGFYHIALAAQVPIALCFMDYSSKTVGLRTHFMPSGDVESDMALIREYYRPFKGKRPANQGPVRVRTDAEERA